MSVPAVSAEDWLEMAVEAAREFWQDSLGMERADKVSPTESATAPSAGAFIPLISGHERLQLGFLSTEPGCADFARVFLGMEEGDGPPEPADVADAVAEVANILAGIMQRMCADGGTTLELGLPIFIHGDADMSHLEKASCRMSFDGIAAQIVLVRGSHAADGTSREPRHP